ncbi:cytochrome c oxidase subunit 2A [Paenibacillus sp. HWE-109]|uniref:cytochrome c oxidase subunit 2A n=1 Tax=Paenibacillus sp. HWE-109 TaxID=1306526 RepID=UPI001EDDAE5A|nr:cytochrome c oxidase subunit 2A [Paenibacillus sp. HWE-109]UKS25502.1 cytochrome c oxidase subunit 2A [Paenibacillus sp. HWE-109]
MDSRNNDAIDKERNNTEQEPILRGTFASVLLLGLFLLVSWVIIFVLFISRQ